MSCQQISGAYNTRLALGARWFVLDELQEGRAPRPLLLQAAAGGAKEVGGRALSAAEQAARGAAYGASGKCTGQVQAGCTLAEWQRARLRTPRLLEQLLSLFVLPCL